MGAVRNRHTKKTGLSSIHDNDHETLFCILPGYSRGFPLSSWSFGFERGFGFRVGVQALGFR